jgi:hypothetical protein
VVKEDKKSRGALRKMFTRKKTSVTSGSFHEAAPNSASSSFNSGVDVLTKQATTARSDSGKDRINMLLK